MRPHSKALYGLIACEVIVFLSLFAPVADASISISPTMASVSTDKVGMPNIELESTTINEALQGGKAAVPEFVESEHAQAAAQSLAPVTPKCQPTVGITKDSAAPRGSRASSVER